MKGGGEKEWGGGNGRCVEEIGEKANGAFGWGRGGETIGRTAIAGGRALKVGHCLDFVADAWPECLLEITLGILVGRLLGALPGIFLLAPKAALG